MPGLLRNELEGREGVGSGVDVRWGKGAHDPSYSLDSSRLCSIRCAPSLEHSKTSVKSTLRNAWEE